MRCVFTTALLLSALSFSAHGAFLHASKPLKNRYIVTLRTEVVPEQVDAIAKTLAHGYQGRLLATMKHAMRGFGVSMTETQALALSNDPLVTLVEEDEEVELSGEAPLSFDFRTSFAEPLKNAKDKGVFTPRTLANNCPWDGAGYFLCTYADDLYWHLDRLENQGQIYTTKRYGYNTTGLGVRAYVIDTGVYAQHSEFDSRVEVGANMTVDPDIADPPLPGEEPVVNLDYAPANNPCNGWRTNPNDNIGHGTGVASVLGGTTVGVAKNVTIVPVKVINCDGQRAKLSVARGLDWILSDMSGRSNRALVSMSTYVNVLTEGNHLCQDGHGGLTNCVAAIENEINNVISANIPVIVSANNQNNGNCTTSPARMGFGNEANFPSPHRTITAGGTMYTIQGGQYIDQIWTCAQQPGGCDAWFYPPTNEGAGSNYGPCVSIWAPAWNVHVAGAAGPNSYRDPMGASSGTSWSAPYTAGVVARLLERNPAVTPDQIWQALVDRAAQRWIAPDFDPSAVVNNRLVYISPFE